ncbi:MAG: tRNA preQ1(34) S-adenosylmethionine ribosyltransferase-isomerase QueA [Oscillospiraceae bacterium]|nr:tRNA preQ1(34) S-adenosylmethionine ribosyltransferase-isomerase QueA [Oscillospiraceae bacterium]
MEKSDFSFELPQKLIAQTPLEPRDASRLMVLERAGQRIKDKTFLGLVDCLNSGDLLVLNNSRVLPARLFASAGDGQPGLEILLVALISPDRWEVMAKPGKRATVGRVFQFGELRGCVLEILPNGNRIMSFEYIGDFFEILDRVGVMPLPPYIKEKLAEKERYQTTYARNPGSIAAPTAGLHFTDRIFARLAARGVHIAFVTLHVGLGTFKPIKTTNIFEHRMHAESFVLPEGTARAIQETKEAGKRVIAVGTTSCRVLESVFAINGVVRAASGTTNIFICPGHEFKVVDGLLTNFHLPESTLIVLVSAFAGREFVLTAYRSAIEKGYRFFSFGDAMLIL